MRGLGISGIIKKDRNGDPGAGKKLSKMSFKGVAHICSTNSSLLLGPRVRKAEEVGNRASVWTRKLLWCCPAVKVVQVSSSRLA